MLEPFRVRSEIGNPAAFVYAPKKLSWIKLKDTGSPTEALGDDGDKRPDPGSRPESQRVASCADRLAVTPSAFGDNGERKKVKTTV